MVTTDPRVDAYIDAAGDFAKPILKHLRALVHKTCPDCTEAIKWRMPAFEYHGLLCATAAFKQHCAFVFFKKKLVFGDDAMNREAMGQFGRLEKKSDLPADKVIVSYLRKAMQLNEGGAKMQRSSARKRPLTVPTELSSALKKNKRALATFEKFPPSHKREYVDWITEAKRDETRAKRIDQAIEWMAEGKSRNWKYMNC